MSLKRVIGIGGSVKDAVSNSKKVRLFIDRLRVHVRAGAGGQGLPKFGGIGGKGGDIYVVGSDKVTLKQVMHMWPGKRIIGKPGENSKRTKLLGPAGKDTNIPVPIGINVFDEFGKNYGDIDEVGYSIKVAEGGKGGDPHSGYLGRKGEKKSVNLDLKLIADVSLVGFPNAGKSTLLSSLSRASPKIASYPFTTLHPQIGVMQYDDLRQISVADLPGLIEGAHVNYGMGHKFLKHIERTKLLLFVVDIFGFQLGPQRQYRTALETILLLNKELELYREDLVSKPAVLALNKIDLEGNEEKLAEIENGLKNIHTKALELDEKLVPKHIIQFDKILAISANQRKSMNELKKSIREILDIYDDKLYKQNDNDNELRRKIENETKEHMGSSLV